MRWWKVGLALAVGLICALGACSSDPETPLGSEFIDDVLGSEPPEVFQDTIAVVGDTVVAFASLLSGDDDLEVGRRDGYVRAAVIRPDFSMTNGDENLVVLNASLRMRLKDGDEIAARFYQLAAPYTEGDSLLTLDTLSVIVDPDANSADRVMTFAEARYPLPIDLVQGWIRGDSTNNGIAVVYVDDGIERVSVFDASEKAGDDADPPTIQVDFVGGSSSSYRVSDDATFVRPTASTSNLIVSDGFVRRIWFRLDLDELSDSSAVHRARIVFNVVPGTLSGSDRVELYVPDSDDVTSAGFRGGQAVIDAVVTDSSDRVEFVVTNALLSVLSESLPDNGFVMRFVGETTGVRFAEFYSSADVSLHPHVVLTSSSPAGFER